MRSSKHAKHAKPSFHPTRSALSAGLTAVLLPLCLASPAVAATTTPSTTGATTTATAVAKRPTTVSLSGPGGTVDPGTYVVRARLLSDGRPVSGAVLRLERSTAGGAWTYHGKIATAADGTAQGRVPFPGTARMRAVFGGSTTQTGSASAPITVTVASFRQRAVQIAAQQKGKPYRYGAVGPNAFDCSGLVKYVFSRVGKALPRTSQEQLRATARLSQGAKRPGDLIFIHRGGRVSHVGVYAGNGHFWVAPKAGDVVKLQRIYTSSYYVGRVR